MRRLTDDEIRGILIERRMKQNARKRRIKSAAEAVLVVAFSVSWLFLLSVLG